MRRAGKAAGAALYHRLSSAVEVRGFGAIGHRSNTLCLSSKLPWAVSTRSVATAAIEPAATGADADGDHAAAELELLKGALAKFVPDKEMQELFKTNETSKLRFSDLPATSRFMESFAAGKMPGDPVYDLPSWLEHNYPQYDASPKSPFYSWIIWIRDNLSREEQRMLLAFHDYMQDYKFRKAILNQANYELARLWDWQHRRAALGLPPELSEAELQAVVAEDAAQAAGGKAGTSAGEGGGFSLDGLEASQPGTKTGAVAAAKESPKPDSKKEQQQQQQAALPGILGIIQKAEQQKLAVQATYQEQLEAQGLVDLTPAQRALVSAMRNPAQELRNLAAAFDDRRQRGEEMLRFSSGTDRARDILRAEFEQRSMAVAEASQLGLDHREAAEKVELYTSGGSTGSGAKGQPELKQLRPSELRLALEGHAHWTDTRLLDHKANTQQLAAREAEVMSAVRKMKRADKRLLERLQDHGYSFHISRTPPTPTLDKLTEYLQVKYMDALVQRQEMDQLTSGLKQQQQHLAQGSGAARSTAAAAAGRTASAVLSPDDVSELNRRATEAFVDIGSTGSATKYNSLIKQLHRAGFIGSMEMEEALAAARIKAMQARAELQPGEISNARQLSPGDRQALHAALTGSSEGTAGSSKMTAGLFGVSQLEEEARALWEGAAKTSFAAWAAKMREHAHAEIALRRSTGDEVSPAAEEELLAAWRQPVSYEEAAATWDAYLAAAGMPHGPRLEQVLLCDKQLRNQQAQTAGGSSATSTAHDMAVQLQEVFDAFVARHGSTVTPLAAAGASDRAAGSGKLPELSWRKVQNLNSKLDVSSPASLKDMFRAASLKEVLAQHWQQTAGRFLPAAAAGSSSSSSSSGGGVTVSSFEDLWGLMRQVYDATLKGTQQEQQQQQQSAVGGSRATGAALPTAASSASSSTERRTDETRNVANDSRVWKQYVKSQEMTAQAHGKATQYTPPYTGAKPLLRFKQTLVLGPSPSSSATSSATGGMGPAQEAGSLDSAPENRAVELRVHVGQLRSETGLSPQAMRHIISICGKERYNSETREIVLCADRHPSREENRRLCLEQLHQLLLEGHAHAPRPEGLGAARVPALAAAFIQ